MHSTICVPPRILLSVTLNTLIHTSRTLGFGELHWLEQSLLAPASPRRSSCTAPAAHGHTRCLFESGTGALQHSRTIGVLPVGILHVPATSNYVGVETREQRRQPALAVSSVSRVESTAGNNTAHEHSREHSREQLPVCSVPSNYTRQPSWDSAMLRPTA